VKILFVSSGNNLFGISPIILNQGKSLEKWDINIEYFTIIGRGFSGYFQNIFKLRNVLTKNKFDLVHAHYSLSAVVASLSFPGIPVIASLMGSDTKMGFFWKFLIKVNSLFFWDRVIVKSERMKIDLRLKEALIIPNGVNLSKFRPIDKKEAKSKLNLKNDKKYILFLSDPARYEKNFKLAEDSVKRINNCSIVLLPVFNKPFKDIANYLFASELVICTSLWEGSPNVIKEAMACDIPIVSTDVGDVKWVLGKTNGCYIAGFDSQDFSEKIKCALNFSSEKGRTTGRQRILYLGLDSETTTKKIVDLYQKILNY
jgi:glycosyltransferase involved in cell wall biosynthesis